MYKAGEGMKVEGGLSRATSLENFLGQDRQQDDDMSHLFMMNKLMSMAPQSASQSMFGLGAASGTPGKPQAKFDPQSGKWYRSFTVDRSLGSFSLDALGAALSSEELCFSELTQSGVVLNLAGSALRAGGEVSFLCVGDNHVHADHLYQEGRVAMTKLFHQDKPAPEAATDAVADSVCGFTLFSGPDCTAEAQDLNAGGACGFTIFNKPVVLEQQQQQAQEGWGGEVVPDSLCGITFLSPAQPSEGEGVELVADGFAGATIFSNLAAASSDFFGGKAVEADSIMGMTMFSYADEEEQEEEDTREAGWGGLEADSTCGMLMLSRAEADSEPGPALEADACAGMTLFSAEGGAQWMKEKRVVATHSLGGMTLFALEREQSARDTDSDEPADEASVSDPYPSVSDPSDTCAWDATADTTGGMTLLSWEQSEPLCTNDVAALLSSIAAVAVAPRHLVSVAAGCAGLSLFARAPEEAVESCAGVTLFA